MKPRVFIASAAESLDVANAIHAGLRYVAECTPWTDGVFTPSASTMAALQDQVAKSDFGIFVFTPDDVRKMRGNIDNVVRDNVVFEMGLSAGGLGTARSFFITPDDKSMQVPSDLAGITPLTYEAGRADNNWKAAVNTACADIRLRVEELGFSPHRMPLNEIRDLVNQYECCEWIEDHARRIAKKDKIFDKMRAIMLNEPINKKAIAEEDRSGCYVALAAAIVNHPNSTDSGIICRLHADRISRGNAQHKLLDAIEAVIATDKANKNDVKSMLDWARRLSNSDENLKFRLSKLKI